MHNGLLLALVRMVTSTTLSLLRAFYKCKVRRGLEEVDLLLSPKNGGPILYHVHQNIIGYMPYLSISYPPTKATLLLTPSGKLIDEVVFHAFQIFDLNGGEVLSRGNSRF